MRRSSLAMLTSWSLLLALPAQAEEFIDGSPTQPTIGYSVASWLTPASLGGMAVADMAATGGSVSTARRDCWHAWAATTNYLADLAGVDPLPVPDVEPALTESPSFCTGYTANLGVPDVLTDSCEAGTVFAVRGLYEWASPDPLPSGRFDPAAHGEFRTYLITASDLTDELIFHFCLDVFVGDDPAGFEEAIPDPTFLKSPLHRGLTGLDTWLWYDFSDPGSHHVTGDGTVEAIVGLPLTLTAQAWVDKVEWDMDGDGVPDAEADVPDRWDTPPDHATYLEAGGANSEEDAADTYLYETKGTYPVTVTVTWRGIYQWNDPLLDQDYLYPYTPVVKTYTEDYPVAEIRGVLTGAG